MIKALFAVITLSRVQFNEVTNKVFGIIGDVIPIRREELVMSSLDLLIETSLVVITERRSTTKKDVNNNTQRPHIDFGAIEMALQDFRSHIPWRTTIGHESSSIGLLSALCKSEISQFQFMSSFGKKNVLGLEISVCNVQIMNVAQGIEKSTNNFTSVRFVIVLTLGNFLKKFSAYSAMKRKRGHHTISKFSDNVVVVRLIKEGFQSDNVGMIQLEE